MKDFFLKFFKKGVMIIFIVVIIWIVYFILNFIDPTLFNFLRTNKNNSNQEATSTTQKNDSFGYKIYNMFFKSSATTSKEIASSTVSKPGFWDTPSTVAWGGGNAEVWGSGQEGSQNALEGMTFVSPNTSKSPIRGMKINALSVNENNFNYLPNGAMISGAIYTGFLDTYYFNADIYDTNGVFLFSIPMTSNHDFNTESFSNFYGQYNKNLNFSNYTGKAYLIIKSNNQNVSGSVLVKIDIK